MGLLVILPFAALAVWTIITVFHKLQRGGYDRKWWNAYKFLSAGGFVLGIWLAFSAHYKVADKQIKSFPIPTVIASLEDGKWTRHPVPTAIRVPAMVTNVLCGMAICLAPLALAALVKELKTQGESRPT